MLLLEAGPADRYPWIHLPIGYGKTMFHPVYNWGFYTEPDPDMNGRRIYWPRGRGLGGSSSINGLIYMRGQPRGLRPLGARSATRLGLARRAAVLHPQRSATRAAPVAGTAATVRWRARTSARSTS